MDKVIDLNLENAILVGDVNNIVGEIQQAIDENLIKGLSLNK